MNINLKKGIVSLLAVGALLAPTASSVFAAEEQDVHGGSEVISAKTQAGLTSGKKDGGYWIRGKDGSMLVSKYKHYKTQGRASVTNGEGDYDDGGWKPVDVYSEASADWTSSGTNKAYYDNEL